MNFFRKDMLLASGISLFILTNICESIIWKDFNSTTINTRRYAKFEASLLIRFVKLLLLSLLTHTPYKGHLVFLLLGKWWAISDFTFLSCTIIQELCKHRALQLKFLYGIGYCPVGALSLVINNFSKMCPITHFKTSQNLFGNRTTQPYLIQTIVYNNGSDEYFL
ncbi:uncharacterized protein LOC107797763 isoform X2 [Nicotiana tabacum]|uniref:Uncharacterized protein LOC107797763 isoform X2 n=3 Tax=Nicotiana TaxID=4085 RepID=A0AC58S7Y7_TOBAC|nr:PREDICTED: uncharacterized protein LOC104223619 isoform X2 [Nicotiana sylvestris]